MNLRRIEAIARKETIQVLRDWRSMVMAIAIPVLMLVLFGFALTLDIDRVPTLVWDQSGSAASRDFISRFSGSRYFHIVGYADHYDQIERAIDSGQIWLALVIPREFADEIEEQAGAKVQAIVDGANSNTALLVIGYSEAIAKTYSQDIQVQAMSRRGMVRVENPLDVRTRVWFNADMRSRNYIIPGLIAVIMMIITALLTSLAVAREWDRGTMEQLVSTPIKGYELVLGKLVPYFGLGTIDLILALLMGQFVFQVPFRGSLPLLFLVAAIFLIGSLSMGLMISIVTKTQLLASQLALTSTLLPAFLLSGFMIPIVNMPEPIQWVTYAVPARYFVAILRGIYLKGVGLETMAWEFSLLTAFGLLMITLAVRKFKKKLT